MDLFGEYKSRVGGEKGYERFGEGIIETTVEFADDPANDEAYQ